MDLKTSLAKTIAALLLWAFAAVSAAAQTNVLDIPPDNAVPADYDGEAADAAFGVAAEAFNAGDYTLAVTILTALLKTESPVWGTRHPWTGTLMLWLSVAHRNLAQTDLALSFSTEALDMFRDRLGDDSDVTLSGAQHHAVNLEMAGQKLEAIQLALDTATRARGQPELIGIETETLVQIWRLANELGYPVDADTAATRMIEILRATEAPDSPLVSEWTAAQRENRIFLAKAYLDDAARLLEQGDFQASFNQHRSGITTYFLALNHAEVEGQGEEAVAAFEADALAILSGPDLLGAARALAGYAERARLEPDLPPEFVEYVLGTHDGLAGPFMSITSVFNDLGRMDLAIAAARLLAQLAESELGEDSPEALGAWALVGQMLTKAGRNEEAIALLSETVRNSTAATGAVSDLTVLALRELELAYEDAEDPGQALQIARTIADRWREADPGGADYVRALAALTEALILSGAVPDALETAQKAVDLAQAHDPETRVQALAALAEAYEASGELTRSIATAEEAEDLARTRLGPDHRETIVLQSQLSVSLASVGRHGDALLMAEKAADAWDRRDEDSGSAIMARLIAIQHLHAMGRLDDAAAQSQATIARASRVFGPAHPVTLEARSTRAGVLQSQSRYEEALTIYRELADTYEASKGPKARDTLMARSYEVGALYWLGALAEAEPLARQVADDMAEVFGPASLETISARDMHAVLLRRLGQRDAAIAVSEAALAARRSAVTQDTPQIIDLMFTLGLDLFDTGRRDEGETLMRQAIERAAALFDRSDPRTRSYMKTFASAIRMAGKADEANRLETEAATVFGGNSDPYWRYEAARADAETLVSQGKPQAARQVLMDLLKTPDADLPNGALSRAEVLGDLVPVHAALGDLIAGREIGQQALDLMAGSDYVNRPWFEFALRGKLANVEIALSDNAGIDRHLLALSQLVDSFDGPDQASARRTERRYAAFARTAQHRPRDAMEAARAALALEDDMLRRVTSDSLDVRAWQRSEIDTVASLFANAAYEVAAQNPSQNAALMAEAFAAAQAGGGNAAEALTRTAARIAASEAGLSQLVRSWEDIVADRAVLDARIANLPAGDALRAELTEQRAGLVARLDALSGQLRDRFPRYFDLISPAPVTLAAFQGRTGLLGPDEALIAFLPASLGQDGLVWAVTREGAAWARLPMREEDLGAEISALHAGLDGAGQTRAPEDARGSFSLSEDAKTGTGFDRDRAWRLYDTLFGAPQIAALIADKTDWILAPRGVLLSLPFATLVMSSPTGGNADPVALRNTAWLGVRKALAVVPSVGSVRSLRTEALAARQSTQSATFFGVADPVFSGTQAQPVEAAAYYAGRSGSGEALRGLASLPGTRLELNSMAQAFDAPPENLLLGPEATETRLAEASDTGRLAAARVVLLATHGLLAGSFDGLTEPALALTPPPDGPRPIDPASQVAAGTGRLDDGLLTASEAARLRLDADWVILSACDTAAGAGPDARGLSGLARAFFYAGARTLLVSHWKVRDDVAARLTTLAVNTAAADPHVSRARALRRAMQIILMDESADASGRSFSHPSAWAPFQVTGVQPL